MKLRMLAAAGVLVSAAVHLYLWFDVFRHTDVVGPAFMLNAVGGTTIAVLLVTWRHWVPLVFAVGFGASTLGAFSFEPLIHRTVLSRGSQPPDGLVPSKLGTFTP